MLKNPMNQTMRTAGAFVLGGMTVLGIWLFTKRQCIMNSVSRLMADMTDDMKKEFKENCCDCEDKTNDLQS